jgi:hypothetical protein
LSSVGLVKGSVDATSAYSNDYLPA